MEPKRECENGFEIQNPLPKMEKKKEKEQQPSPEKKEVK